MIIEKIIGKIENFQVDGRAVEKILLDRERLSKPHQKLRTEADEIFGLSLPQGCVLNSGDVIYADENRVVVIELEPEDSLAIRPKGHIQWARAAYNIGNMHQVAYIHDDCILTPYDVVLESIIQKLQIPYERMIRPIDGVRATVSQHEEFHHHHNHENIDNHDHGQGEWDEQ